MKVALITGITGQDGSYLAELLLEKGYIVHGLIRRSSSINTGRINHIYSEPHEDNRRLVLHYADLTDAPRLITLLEEVQPDEIYNLAAQSHVAVSFQEPGFTGMVNALAVTSLLEAIRISRVPCKFYQASTSELFGDSAAPQCETTAFRPRSPYAASKLYAYWMVKNYREAYDLHASNGILFNHESPRRGATFVTKKITQAVAAIADGRQEFVYLGNIEAIRDWGYAPEYVEGMWRMLQRPEPDDYVLATGVGTTIADFAKDAFGHVGLDFEKHIKIDSRYIRPTEVDQLIGDYSKARELLGWSPTTLAPQLARLMVDFDIANLRKNTEN